MWSPTSSMSLLRRQLVVTHRISSANGQHAIKWGRRMPSGFKVPLAFTTVRPRDETESDTAHQDAIPTTADTSIRTAPSRSPPGSTARARSGAWRSRRPTGAGSFGGSLLLELAREYLDDAHAEDRDGAPEGEVHAQADQAHGVEVGGVKVSAD